MFFYATIPLLNSFFVLYSVTMSYVLLELWMIEVLVSIQINEGGIDKKPLQRGKRKKKNYEKRERKIDPNENVREAVAIGILFDSG